MLRLGHRWRVPSRQSLAESAVFRVNIRRLALVYGGCVTVEEGWAQLCESDLVHALHLSLSIFLRTLLILFYSHTRILPTAS